MSTLPRSSGVSGYSNGSDGYLTAVTGMVYAVGGSFFTVSSSVSVNAFSHGAALTTDKLAFWTGDGYLWAMSGSSSKLLWSTMVMRGESGGRGRRT